jgi:hypothetical protein
MFLEPEMPFEHSADASENERQTVIGLMSPSPIDLDDLIRESRLHPAAMATSCSNSNWRAASPGTGKCCVMT